MHNLKTDNQNKIGNFTLKKGVIKKTALTNICANDEILTVRVIGPRDSDLTAQLYSPENISNFSLMDLAIFSAKK